MMRSRLRRWLAALHRRALLHRSAQLARRAAGLMAQRDALPLASRERMLLNAQALELCCESSALQAEAMGDQLMAREHRIEAAEFGRRARQHACLGAFA
ncbi:hypothetical protein HMPREF9946_04018 [Acetobacteraceae bacterium AT-5844]|nr:hypothetical protein HMPREF9946_04018 [Acetobacteraceae bacterium AT-5844]